MATKIEDADDEPQQWVNGARAYGVLQIALGFAAIGVCVPYFQRLEQVTWLKDLLNEGNVALAQDLDLPLMTVAGGAISIISGIIAIFAYCNSPKFGKQKSRVFVFGAVLLNLAAAGLTLYPSVRIIEVLDGLLGKLVGNPIADPSFTEDEAAVLDMINAVFNDCCIPEYDSLAYKANDNVDAELCESGTYPVAKGTCPTNDLVDDNQRPVPVCVPGNVADSCNTTGIFPDLITTIVVDTLKIEIDDLLCTCIEDQDKYNKFSASIAKNDYCTKFRDLVVEKADDRAVPTVSLTFGQLVKALGTQRPYADQIPMGKFAMVGKMLPPKSVYGEPSEEIGWSCGLGYAKGVGYQMYLYIRDTTEVLEIGGLAIGACMGVFSLLLGVFLAVGAGGSVDDDYLYSEDDYRDEL